MKKAFLTTMMAVLLTFGMTMIGCGQGGGEDSNSGGQSPNGNADYGIDLSVTATYTFPSAAIGYAEQTAKSVTITNTGKQPTGGLVAVLSGDNEDSFDLSPLEIASIAAGKTAAFTVVPKSGLAEGVYNAAVTVSGGSVPAKSFAVRFTADDSLSSNATVFTSLAEALAYLNARTDGNAADNPVPLKLNINLSSYTNGWNALVDGLLAAGKYAALDLSLCSMNGTVFDLYHDTGPDPNDGRKYIVSLVLPDSATSIVNSGSYIIPPEYTPIIKPGGPGGGPVSAPSVANSGGYMPYYNEIPIIVNSDYSSLKTVSGANVETIGSYAFTDCTSLTTASFPKVTSIGGGDTHGNRGAFEGCKSLTTVSFPKATSIRHSAFSACTALTTVSFPEATSVSFDGCTALTSMSAPKATSVSFDGCTALTSVSLPEATSVSFGGCTALTSVSFPEATSVSFDGCTALTSVSFPEATSVSFDGCTALTEVSAPKAASVSFNNCKSLPLSMVNFSEATELSLSGFTSLTEISAPKAISVSFGGCTALTTVSAPNATSVSFSGCTALTTVSVPKVTRIEFYAFRNSGTTPLVITMGAAAPTVSGGTFNGVTAKKNVTVRVPSGATGYDEAWQDAFKGYGSDGGGTVNSNINVAVEYGE